MTLPTNTPPAPVTSGAPTTISADALGSTTPKAFTIPPPTTSTPTIPTVGAPVGTTTDSNGNATLPQNSSSADTQGWLKNQLANLGSKLGLKGDVTTQLQNDNQLSTKTMQATADFNAYNSAKLALQQKIESMHNAEGGTTAGNAQAIEVAQREGNANLANLAVIAQSSQGLLSAAEKTIQDKVDAQFKPIQDEIDFITKFSTVNNNDLSDSDKEKLALKAEKQKTDAASVQTATSDIHQKLLSSGAPASAYSAIDVVTNKFINGQLSATDAQSQMYEAASKYGVSDSSTLSKGDIQNAAVNAGISVKDFKALDSDVQAYFAKAPQKSIDAWDTILSGVKDNSLTVDDATKQINSSNIAQSVKDYMLSQVKALAPKPTESGGFWSSFKSFLGIGGSTTTMTGPDGKQYNVPNDKVDSFKANGYK